MDSKPFIICIVVISIVGCYGKYLKSALILDDESPSLYDDIRLTPEQEQEKKERGFLTARKWTKVNGVVTVPYYFDSISFPTSDPFRNKFKFVAQLYKTHTCIDWVEVAKTDTRHKVRLFRGDGCWSSLGMTSGAEQNLSLADGCHTNGTILHEMGHAMGLDHVQSRPDRDNYVKIWLKNVSPGLEHNFDKSTGETFNIPYDYKSMMHYGYNYFSINGSFTLTTIDPFAMFAIGARPDTFRYSDAAFLNKGYECIVDFTKSCGEKNCLNGGFVGKDCKCRCPENTSGDRCGTVTGPFFNDKPTCGGSVTTEGDIVPKGYPTASTLDQCIFAIKAPTCKVPAITFTAAKFYWTVCGGNMLSLQVSPSSYGYTWCDASKVPLNKVIVSETQTANIFYFIKAQGFANLGFRARVQFVNDPKCGPGGSTVSTTTTTTTTVAPVTSCRTVDTGTNSFDFSSNNFPSTVKAGTICSMTKNPPNNTTLIFSKLEVDFQGAGADLITLTDTFFTLRFPPMGKINMYVVWPTTITLNVSSSTGKGFKISARPATGLPSPCNGETVTLTTGQIRKISNPLFGQTTPHMRCAFLVVAPVGRKVVVRALVKNLSWWQQLRVTPYLPSYDYYHDITSSPTTAWSNQAKIYYIGSDTYGQWEIELSSI